MRNSNLIITSILLLFSNALIAGGWDNDKGMDKVQLKGELVCMGCSLKKLSGVNAQCGLYIPVIPYTMLVLN